MSSYELIFVDERPKRNFVTGQFLKGHIPHNKGKKWSEWASKRTQKKMAKGWKNLDKFRPIHRPDNAGRCRKPIIAILPSGKFIYFKDSNIASEWCKGERGNVNRCCRSNSSMRVNLKTGKINTDHKYLGIKWYFESDVEIWKMKVENK